MPQQNKNTNPTITSPTAKSVTTDPIEVHDDEGQDAVSARFVTPKMRAEKLVRENIDEFLKGQTTSRRAADAIVKAMAECPEGDRPTFKTEVKQLCTNLKMFGEMLFNELVANTATVR